VQPQPDDFTGRHWLPAEALAIEDSWEGDAPPLNVGEPVSRTLTITATGLAGSQIPRIEVPAPDGVRVYAEPADAETRTDGERLFGVSRQQVTLMPAAAGRLRFPEIRLRWWDVDAGRERSAVVPARTFYVAGAGGDIAADGGEPAAAAGAGAGASASADAVPDRLAETRRPSAVILLVAVAAMALVWLWRRRAPIAGWLRRMTATGTPRRRGADARADPAAHRIPSAAGRRPRGLGPLARLQTACAADDARGAAAALPPLARQHWGPGAPSSLGGIAGRLERDNTPEASRAAAAVRALEAVLYGPGAGLDDWRGTELAAAMPAVLRAPSGGPARETGAGGSLAPLYPPRG
jgi:hypothetical protein